ncbi:lysozyme inhibitor LprI family protein [Methylomagnum ishizawai]|uniref:lysozyme inhibitor LprI family protein n=1 Tax=Methylomagnum ishizawai TaxID=1760988 RepID=UPI001C3261C1|nr:lysozyme inhibitor LprI family protein [Methylomagnum ishizawai]BBL73695.1 hypothetical protein MishRS11D_07930 [Methylomagnum ishizawai]
MSKSQSILAVAITIMLANTSIAASFDCVKAGTQVEKLICNHSQLSALDEQLSEIYRTNLAKSGNSASLTQDQRSWLKTQRNSCANIDCLKQAYTQRIGVLNSVSPEPAKSLSGKTPDMGSTGIEETALRIMFRNMQTYVKNNQVDQLADLASYPFNFNTNKIIEAKNKAEFVRYYNRLINEEFKRFMATFPYEQVESVGSKGLMLGNGQVWIIGDCVDQACMKIVPKLQAFNLIMNN